MSDELHQYLNEEMMKVLIEEEEKIGMREPMEPQLLNSKQKTKVIITRENVEWGREMTGVSVEDLEKMLDAKDGRLVFEVWR